jgi:hypothetical protein
VARVADRDQVLCGIVAGNGYETACDGSASSPSSRTIDSASRRDVAPAAVKPRTPPDPAASERVSVHSARIGGYWWQSRWPGRQRGWLRKRILTADLKQSYAIVLRIHYVQGTAVNPHAGWMAEVHASECAGIKRV